MNTDKVASNLLSEKIIGCAFVVSNTLGVGFLEKVYENALAHELRKAGLLVEQQHAITVHYDGVVIGSYTADLLVEKVVLVELKAVSIGYGSPRPMHQLPEGHRPSALPATQLRGSKVRDQTRGEKKKPPH